MNNELKHFGILGQKWGIRRFQNEDGSLTPEGEKRYGAPMKFVSGIRKGEQSVDRAVSSVKGKAQKAKNISKTYLDAHPKTEELLKIGAVLGTAFLVSMVGHKMDPKIKASAKKGTKFLERETADAVSQQFGRAKTYRDLRREVKSNPIGKNQKPKKNQNGNPDWKRHHKKKSS